MGERAGKVLEACRRWAGGWDRAQHESCPTFISIRCSEARCTSGRPRCRGTRTGAAIRPRTAAVVGWRRELPQMACRFGEPQNTEGPKQWNQKIKTLGTNPTGLLGTCGTRGRAAVHAEKTPRSQHPQRPPHTALPWFQRRADCCESILHSRASIHQSPTRRT